MILKFIRRCSGAEYTAIRSDIRERSGAEERRTNLRIQIKIEERNGERMEVVGRH